MYQTLKKIYEFYPALLNQEQQCRFVKIKAKRDEYDKRREVILEPYYKKREEKIEKLKAAGIGVGIGLRDKYPDKEIDALNDELDMSANRQQERDLCDDFYPQFLNSFSLEFATPQEAFSAYLKESVRIKKWYDDVSEHQEDLMRQGKDEHSTSAARNYWFFMEWQSDFYNLGNVLFALNGSVVPDVEGVSSSDIYDAFTILCGAEDITGAGVEKLLNSLKHSLATASAWAYDTDEDWLLKGQYPNTTQESFEKHIESWVAIYKFLEKENPSEDFITKATRQNRFSIQEQVIYQETIKTSPLVAISNLDEFAQTLSKIINLNKNWLLENKNYLSNGDEGIGYYANGLKEVVYNYSVALAILKQKFPSLEVWNTDLFEDTMSVAAEFGAPIEKSNYEFNFMDLMFSKKDYLSALFFNKDLKNSFGLIKDIYSLSLSLQRYSEHLKESDLDTSIEIKVSKNGDEYMVTSTTVDLIELAKDVTLIENDLSYDPQFFENLKIKRKENKEKLKARLAAEGMAGKKIK